MSGPSGSSHVAELSLLELSEALRARTVSSREATEALLARIAEWQPHLNAFVEVEAEEALAAADAADRALARGEVQGPLHGVPLAHKDMFYQAGRVSGCGSALRRDWVAGETATVLERLAGAGTVRLGRLHMAEFAYGPTGHNQHFGPARNPWAPEHLTGGSSSGSAAAVAARLTPAALGSDTGGSVRMPAHFCGVTGLKTTTGLVSRAGAMPLSFSLDTVGPLARDARDCALVLGLIAGADPRDATTATAPLPDYVAACGQPLAGLRLGIPRAFYFDDLEPGMASALEEARAALEAEGVAFTEVDLPDQRPLSAAALILLGVEAAALHRPWLLERPEAYGDQVRARLQNGFGYSGIEYADALRFRGPALSAFLEATRDVHALFAPVARLAAPTIAATDIGGGADAELLIQAVTRLMRPVNYLGLPALVVPIGRVGALPVGMQLIGKPFDEALLLRLGAGFQRATDHHRRAPVLP